jgi:peptidoglycan hydrolase-like protein with peptidoglycan-binding domain
MVAIVVAGASVGVVLAAPAFDITTLISGFIRYDNGHPYGGCVDNLHSGDYCYGYGWSGNLQEWGYGYGYKSSDFPGEAASTLAAEYGFDGDDGSATIESIVTTQTTATITYSTNYLSRMSRAYTLDPEGGDFMGIEEEHSFNSGERVWSITGLACDTTYYIGINAWDAGDNRWLTTDSFTTDSCNGVRIGGRVNNISQVGTTTNHNPRGLVLPPITLSFGSFGNDVKNLQILLNFFGTFLASRGAGSPGSETEFFGSRTRAAVKKFQATFGLEKVDGIYGQETYNTMKSFLE